MKLVIFDFDGVLVNTSELSYKIHTFKNKDFTYKEFQDYSNGNFHEGYEKAVKEGKHLPTDDYFSSYKKGLEVLTIEKILHKTILSLAKKYRLAIVSSTESAYINEFLKKENAVECFSDILGTDVHRSKVVKISSLLEKYNLIAEDAVFITDTLGDIREANECKVKTIGVTWGLHDRSNLEKGNPVKIIDDPQDLVSAIESVLK